jgi:hypothetical protein
MKEVTLGKSLSLDADHSRSMQNTKIHYRMQDILDEL